MPTYTYRCTNGHDVEAVQAFTDAPLTVCPECGAPLRKTYGSVGVVFKGSGFYRNDSRDEGKRPGSDAGTDGAKKETPKSDGGGKDSGGKDSGGTDSGGKTAATKVPSTPAAKAPASSSGSGGSSGT